MEMEKKGHIRVQPDQYNYRSPKKYVSLIKQTNLIMFIVLQTPISTYYKDLQKNRVFSMDGKMQLLRTNIR